jgi:hypothetical protein
MTLAKAIRMQGKSGICGAQFVGKWRPSVDETDSYVSASAL